jgi:lipopolysaccharide biosynthesis protein
MMVNRSWLKDNFRRSASSVPIKWVRNYRVLFGDRICLFVTYAPGGRIPSHSLFHAREWARSGFNVTLIIVLDKLEMYQPTSATDFAHGLCLRLNEGYDFGAWAGSVVQTADFTSASLLAFANDSVYGPFDTFSTMLRRVDASSADIIGLTESFQIRHHIQSYLIFFRQSALRKRAFMSFWRGVKTGDRAFVIDRYELNLLSRMERSGLKIDILFPITDGECNPTLSHWRELIQNGYPFIKVQLLRDNPTNVDISDWKQILARKGYDLELIREHIGAR